MLPCVNCQAVSLIEEAFDKLPSPAQADLQELKAQDPEKYEERLKALWEVRQVELMEAQGEIINEPELIKDLLLGVIPDHEDQLNETEIAANLLALEDLVQDFDKAVVFTSLGGFEGMMLLLRMNIPNIQALVSFVIGSCSKYNQIAQDRAREVGVLELLLESPFDFAQGDLEIKKVYALGALCRGNQVNMKLLIDNGWFKRVVEEIIDIEAEKINFRLVKKVLALHEDILAQTGDETVDNLTLETLKLRLGECLE